MKPRLAVFDLDGTLIDGDSHVRLVRALLADGRVSLRRRAEVVRGLIGYGLGLVDNAAIKAHAARCFEGRTVAELSAHCRAFSERAVLPFLRPELVGLVEAERKQGRIVVLLSASIEPIVQEVGAAIGVDRVVAAKLETRAGIVTGRIDGEVPYGPAKARAMVRLAEELGADLAASSGYGDHRADLEFLGLVGAPHAVTPDPHLRAHARRHGWPIVERPGRSTGR